MHNVFHVSLLKPHFGIVPLPRAPIFVDDESEEFEVEKILQKRIFKNKVEYLVKWKGYDVYDSTWEPLSNLTNCQSLLKQFEKASSSK